MAISRADAFFGGYNPYTGESLNRQEAASAYYQSAAASPQDTVAPAQPPVNPQEVLGPLASAQTELNKARYGLGKVSQFWKQAEGEARNAESQAQRAQSDLYPAEQDTEETDHSRTGSWVNRSLDSIGNSLSRLQWDASTPTHALYEIKQQISSAQGYLSQVDSSRLSNPWQLQQALSNVQDLQSRVYRIEQAQSQLESKLSGLQTPLSEARYDLNQVEHDREGVSVAYPAREARSHLTTLTQQLNQVQQHLRYASSDLDSAESTVASAEQGVQAAYQDYQYSWQTSDRRA